MFGGSSVYNSVYTYRTNKFLGTEYRTIAIFALLYASFSFLLTDFRDFLTYLLTNQQLSCFQSLKDNENHSYCG
jgi:hypothetical protein